MATLHLETALDHRELALRGGAGDRPRQRDVPANAMVPRGVIEGEPDANKGLACAQLELGRHLRLGQPIGPRGVVVRQAGGPVVGPDDPEAPEERAIGHGCR